MWKKENSEQGKYESRPNKGRKLKPNKLSKDSKS